MHPRVPPPGALKISRKSPANTPFLGISRTSGVARGLQNQAACPVPLSTMCPRHCPHRFRQRMGGDVETEAVTLDLLRRYDRPGPRYTSYPTAVEFHDGFGAGSYATHLAAAAEMRDAPLSLYVHLPFCESRCAFCGCSVIVTRKRQVAEQYLSYLVREIRMVAQALRRAPSRRPVPLGWRHAELSLARPDADAARGSAAPLHDRSERRTRARGRSTRHVVRTTGDAARPGLQPAVARRTGLRPGRAAGRQSHPGRRRDAATWSRMPARSDSRRSTST